MKNIVYLLFLTVLLAACGKPKKEVIATYPNNQPRLVYYITEKDGKKERIKEEGYYESAKIRYSGDFENEKPKGTWKYFYENGNLFAEADFNEKSLMGENWRFYDVNQKPLLADLKSITNIGIDAANCPVNVLYNENGLQVEIQFHENFILRMKGGTKNKIQEGVWTYWFDNGNKQTEGTFANGVLEGLQEVFYESGKVYYKGSYINGHRVGDWTFYDEKGNVTRVQNFDKK